MSSYKMPSQEIPVIAEKEVLVLGGGPAGVAAAVAAARNGADVGLVERYPYLGGMATGGLVIILMRYDANKVHIYTGIPWEILNRLRDLEGGCYGPPPREVWGSTDPKDLAEWEPWGFGGWRSEQQIDGKEARWVLTEVRSRATVNPELLKYVCNEMLMEARVKLWLHSNVISVIKEGDTAKGVVVFSKSGFQAIMGKVLIDATGDGDVMAGANVEFDTGTRPFALNFRFGNVDIEKALNYLKDNREKWLKAVNTKLMDENQTRGVGLWEDIFVKDVNPNVVDFSNVFAADRDALSVEELTRLEINARRRILKTLDVYKKHLPGFESSFLLDTATQVGVRESRKLVGEYVITGDDVEHSRRFDDVVAKGIPHLYYPDFDIPYRSLLPKDVNGLIITGRPISMDHRAFTMTQALIVQCFATGEAAGTAAAIAIKEKALPRNVKVDQIQGQLRKQGVFLG